MVEQALQAPQAGALALGQGVGGRAERKPAVQGAQRGQRVVVERDGLGHERGKPAAERHGGRSQAVLLPGVGAQVLDGLAAALVVGLPHVLAPGPVQAAPVPVEPGLFPEVVQRRRVDGAALLCKEPAEDRGLGLVVVHERIVHVKEDAADHASAPFPTKKSPVENSTGDGKTPLFFRLTWPQPGRRQSGWG